MSVLIFGGDLALRSSALTALENAGVNARASLSSSPIGVRDETSASPVELMIVFADIQFAGAPVTTGVPSREGERPPDNSVNIDRLNVTALEALVDIAPVALVSSQSFDSTDMLSLLRVGIRDLQVGLDVTKVTQLLARIRTQALTHQTQQLRLAKELQRDQVAGQYVQMGMLPPSPMAIGHYRLRHKIWPSLMLSGDFVDYFEISAQQIAFYVADVAGHGASSAFVTVLLKNFSRRLRREFTPSMLDEPGEVLNWLNAELLDNGLRKHVAILFGVVNCATNELRLANAGHFPPAILIQQGNARLLEQPSKPAGLFPDVNYTSISVELGVGDGLMVVSDGVFEHLAGEDLALKERRLLTAAGCCDGDSDRFWQELECDPGAMSGDDTTWFLLTREA